MIRTRNVHRMNLRAFEVDTSERGRKPQIETWFSMRIYGLGLINEEEVRDYWFLDYVRSRVVLSGRALHSRGGLPRLRPKILSFLSHFRCSAVKKKRPTSSPGILRKKRMKSPYLQEIRNEYFWI